MWGRNPSPTERRSLDLDGTRQRVDVGPPPPALFAGEVNLVNSIDNCEAEEAAD